MGNFCGPCFKGTVTDASDLITPDAETRRRQMAEAAERRQHEQESRGVKDPASVKRMQEKAREMEQLERQKALSGQTNLRWSQD